MGGILHRINDNHYNLYNEEEELVGSVHRLPHNTQLMDREGGYPHFTNVSGEDRWFGIHHATRVPTFMEISRHNAAKDLLIAHHNYKTGGPGDVPPL